MCKDILARPMVYNSNYCSFFRQYLSKKTTLLKNPIISVVYTMQNLRSQVCKKCVVGECSGLCGKGGVVMGVW